MKIIASKYAKIYQISGFLGNFCLFFYEK